MILEDVWIDVAAGKESRTGAVKSRRVELRATEHIVLTTEFDVEKFRAHAHVCLDAALDELKTVLEFKKSGQTVG